MIPMIDPVKTGENIKNIVKENGYKAGTIANMLKLSDKSTVYKWFRGETLPDIANIFALSDILGVKMDDLVAKM